MVVPTNPSTKKRKIVAPNNPSTKKRKMANLNLEDSVIVKIIDDHIKLLIFRIAIDLGISINIFDISSEILEKIHKKSQEVHESLTDLIQKNEVLCEFYKNTESKKVTPSIIEKFKELDAAEEAAANKLGKVFNRVKNNLSKNRSKP